MKIAKVQFAPWDKIYNFDARNIDLTEGDKVIVKTELGTEIGTVAEVKDIKGEELEKFLDLFTSPSLDREVDAQASTQPDSSKDTLEEAGQGDDKTQKEDTDSPKKDKEDAPAAKKKELKPIMRKASVVDLERLPSKEKKEEAIKFCKEMTSKHQLPMKLVDVHFAFDGSRITFAFIADGRIDFRELVKDLTRRFNRTIRLQQIGIRDEAKLVGDCGHCGRRLCCNRFLSELTSITSDMAEMQQCAHRGSDRISGICGRLMCCLAFENKGYEELGKKMPAIGTKVKVDGQRGVVVGHHILKQSVDVKFPAESGEGSTVVEVDLNRNK